MTVRRLVLPDAAATGALGARLAGPLAASGGCVFLRGPLGAGKTTLVRGLLRALGHAGPVRSPTYTLIEPYRVGGIDVCHVDLYRLTDPLELETLGLRDHLLPAALTLIEWPERGHGVLPRPDLEVRLAVRGDGRAAELAWAAGAGLAAGLEALLPGHEA